MYTSLPQIQTWDPITVESTLREYTHEEEEEGEEEEEHNAKDQHNARKLSHESPLLEKNSIGDTPTGQGGVIEDATTFNPGWRFSVAIGAICVLVLMTTLDATSISVAIPKITAQLQGTSNS